MMSNQRMLVSIIIPTYNRAAFLREAVESAYSQDWQNKEIIVVDDGSVDGTLDILSEFENKVKYICVKNGGVSRARNIGLNASDGRLIAFLDSDDLWLPGKLARQVEFFSENNDISVCQTEEVWERKGKRVNPKRIHAKCSGWIFENCIPRCIVSPSAVMLRREVFEDIGMFDENMPVCEDYDLWLRTALRYQIVTLPDRFVVKRGGHKGQLSGRHSQDIWRIYALEKILKDKLCDPIRADIVRKDICRRAAIVAGGAAKRGREDISVRYLELVSKYER